MKNKIVKKSFTLLMMFLLLSLFIISAVDSSSLKKKGVTDSLYETSIQDNIIIAKTEPPVQPDKIAPVAVRSNELQSFSLSRMNENYFYGYVVSPPPTGPINLSSWQLLGPGIDPNFIAGADIDDYGHWYGAASTGGLYFIDFNGTMTFIGNSPPMNGLCFDAITQTWYGSGNHNFYIVDITTGQTTLVGVDGIANTIIGLACDNDGNIYGYDVLYSGISTLYKFDKSNGTATAIGPMGVGFLYAQDPAYDRDNCILYIAGYTQMGISGLYTCDVTTGAVTLVGGIPGNIEIDGFAITWTPDNLPPEPPVINGPTSGIVNVAYTFWIGPLTDPEGDSIFCKWDWGDGYITDWLGPYASGDIISASHLWTEPGVYEIRANLKDTYGAESYWSEPHIITIVEGGPPIKPIIKGPSIGRVGVAYNFTVVITDPEADIFFYLIDWGDGDITDWLGPYDSGEEVTVSHVWSKIEMYSIRVIAKNSLGEESSSDPFDIQIVELKKSFLLGVFHNQTETEDLRIIDTNFLIIVPSDSIMYSGARIVIAKNYRFGFMFSSLVGGVFDAIILVENPSCFFYHPMK